MRYLSLLIGIFVIYSCAQGDLYRESCWDIYKTNSENFIIEVDALVIIDERIFSDSLICKNERIILDIRNGYVLSDIYDLAEGSNYIGNVLPAIHMIAVGQIRHDTQRNVIVFNAINVIEYNLLSYERSETLTDLSKFYD